MFAFLFCLFIPRRLEKYGKAHENKKGFSTFKYLKKSLKLDPNPLNPKTSKKIHNKKTLINKKTVPRTESIKKQVIQ